ncbi:MAG: hypothetical protein GY737_20985 [Desulfobacteraceae bacterium]|nr:hypothetical protein [Desulfobacteraceae bacterium]
MSDKKIDISKYDIFTGEPNSSWNQDDINELVVKLAGVLADSSAPGSSRKKMSYSISPLSQVLIKKTAEETGTTQGSIVETAPLLFAKVAMDSLERRAKNLKTLKTLHQQVTRSLRTFATLAPHLEPFTGQLETLMDEILEMEKEAVADRNYQGVDPSGYPTLNKLKTGNGEREPPYNKEITDFLQENKLLASLFKQYKE